MRRGGLTYHLPMLYVAGDRRNVSCNEADGGKAPCEFSSSSTTLLTRIWLSFLIYTCPYYIIKCPLGHQDCHLISVLQSHETRPRLHQLGPWSSANFGKSFAVLRVASDPPSSSAMSSASTTQAHDQQPTSLDPPRTTQTRAGYCLSTDVAKRRCSRLHSMHCLRFPYLQALSPRWAG